VPPSDKLLTQTPAELAAALAAVTADEAFLPTTPGIGDSFDGMSLGLVRRAHATNALANPDGSAVFEYQDSRLAVVSQARVTPNGAFVLLVLAYANPGKAPFVPGAFRLYGDEGEVRDLARDARASFQAFLERYAIPFPSEGRRVFFLPVMTVPIVGGVMDMSKAFGVSPTPDQKWIVIATFRGLGSGGSATAMWPFVIDTARYEADVKAHMR
jgi:hypothetical protein